MKCPACSFESAIKGLFIRMIVKTRVPDTKIWAIKATQAGIIEEDPNFGIYICPKCGCFVADTTLLETT